MFAALPLTLLSLLSATRLAPGSPHALAGSFSAKAGLLLLLGHLGVSQAVSLDKRANLQTSANGTSFIWIIQDTYEGKTFFECVQFQSCVQWRRLMGDAVQHISLLHQERPHQVRFILAPSACYVCSPMSPYMKWHGQVSVCMLCTRTWAQQISLLLTSYTDRDTAFAKNLSFVTGDDKVIMKGDDYSWLDAGVYRNRFVHKRDMLSIHMFTFLL